MAQSEKKLIRMFKNGNQDSFKELYLRYSDLLYAFILHQLGSNREVASDIWQETWVIAVEKIGDFHFSSSFFTWLCAIAKNKISDYYRLKEKHQKFSYAIEYTDIDSKDTEVVDNKTQEDVLIALGDLNGEYRNLLMARYFDNKSIEEIAILAGKSYKATESMLSRSREAFRKRFMQIHKQ